MRTAERLPRTTQGTAGCVVLDSEIIVDDAEFAQLLVEDAGYSLRDVADVFVEERVRDHCIKILAVFEVRDLSASSATRHATESLIQAFEVAGLPRPRVTRSRSLIESEMADLREGTTI